MDSIEEVRFSGTSPSIGYTDYIKIYTSTSVRGKYLQTLRSHEKSHIWLQHYQRGQRILGLDHKKWNIACDLEIALYIYSDKDNNNIAEPRSPLKGGIITKDCDKYPNCVYAEDFYSELLKSDENQLNSTDVDGNTEIRPLGPEELEELLDKLTSVDSLIEKAVSEINEIIDASRLTSLQEDVSKVDIKPSLASEIDRYLGRFKVRREKSYKRPNRRGHNDELLRKGVSSKRKAPTLTIYVDRSGSFDETKTRSANDTLNKVVLKYRGGINKDVLYFNDVLLQKDPIKGGGGTNYKVVIDNIIKDMSQLSVIITDDDSCDIETLPKNISNILVMGIGVRTQVAKVLGVKELII
jgi:predicted metal-dependent peptidase